MNEQAIIAAYRQYIRDEDLDDKFFEFNYWFNNYAPHEAREVIESTGPLQFYVRYLS